MRPAGGPGRAPGAGFPAAWLGLGLLLAACNGGGGGPAANADGELIGKWILRKYRSEGYLKLGTLTFPMDEDTTLTDDRSYIDLKADRTFVSDIPDPGTEGETTVEMGTWSHAGSVLTTIGSVDGEGEPDTVKWDVALNATGSGTEGVFSYHIDVKDGDFEQKQDVLINAVRK